MQLSEDLGELEVRKIWVYSRMKFTPVNTHLFAGELEYTLIAK